jgi:hypothetical protein
VRVDDIRPDHAEQSPEANDGQQVTAGGDTARHLDSMHRYRFTPGEFRQELARGRNRFHVDPAAFHEPDLAREETP